MSDQAARLAETVKEALHFALSRTTDDPVQYRRIAAALAAVDELARVSREAVELREVRDAAADLASDKFGYLAARKFYRLRAALAVAGGRQP